jgi:hypothetical protein
MDWHERQRIDRENERRQEAADRMRANAERIKEDHRRMRQEMIDRQRHNEIVQSLRSSRGGGASSNLGSGAGLAALAGILLAVWMFVTFAPWILGVGAALLFGIGIKKLLEIVFAKDAERAWQSLVALVIAGVAGFYGYIKGLDIQKEYNSESLPASDQRAPEASQSNPASSERSVP